MLNSQSSETFISSQYFLQIIAKASQGYKEDSSLEEFISFLRKNIFDHLGDVSVEIYFCADNQNDFIPSPSQPTLITNKFSTNVPKLIPTTEPLLTELLTHKTYLVLNNTPDTPSFLLGNGNRSQALFPISQGSETTAFLYVGCRGDLPFPDEYLHGVQTISLLISGWLKSIDGISHLKSSKASLEHSDLLQQALYDINEQAHLPSSEQDLFSSLHEIVGRVVNARNFFIALKEEKDGEDYLNFVYYFDERDSYLQGSQIKIDPKEKLSMTGFILQSGKPLLLGPNNFDQFCQDNKIKYIGSKSYSLIGIPFIQDHIAGVVLVQSYSDVIYTEKDKDLLVYVARHIGNALERKKTIDYMRNANEIHSLSMRYTPLHILIKEVSKSQNRVVHASENFYKITGIPPSQLAGKCMTELFPEDFAAKVIADDWKVVSSGIPMQKEQYLAGRTYTTIKFPIKQQGKTLLAAYSIDITKRKKMEETLRESERRYRIIFEKSPLGVVSFDTQGKVLDFNDKFVEIMGSTREKLLRFDAANLSTPSARKAIKKALAGQFASSEDAYTSVTGGKTTYLRGTFSPVVPGQSPTEIIATIEDITKQKEHEKEQQKIEKLESLGVLAGGIAHDFNNILTSIMANISFARILTPADHKSLNSLAEAEKASRRAAELAQQLLTFAKGGVPHKKVISAQHLIEEAVSLMLSGSNVRAFVNVPDTIHAVEADEGQISQVLNNIIINGSQAMPGGGTLNISAENVVLPASNPYDLAAGTYIKIILQDEGCGISQKDKEKIFDPYFTTKIKGTGLGLASAYSIITRHNGQITVSSIVDGGTIFTIHLPSLGNSYTEHLTAVSKNTHSRNGETVLVMDDEEMIRDIVKTMLSHLGYTVTTCTEGEEAIELYRQSLEAETPFWAVIVDLTIPGGLGGAQTAERILNMDPGACVIVSSGYSNDPIMANYQRNGFAASIAKPYSIDEFEQVLNSLPVH